MSNAPEGDDLGPDMMFGTVQELLSAASQQIPPKDARLLFAMVAGVAADRVTLMLRDNVTLRVYENVMDLVERRRGGEPVSHLLGGREFYGRWFSVTRHTLDPRPETETLIECALKHPFREVLDLGTGTGCILITLLAERPDTTGIGVDVSEAALEVARQNAVDLGVANRCGFEPSNWFSGVGGTYDLIVSNPPYIAADEMSGLSVEVAHEPRIALTDEGDGLSCYRIIAAQAGAYLADGGWLMVEIGPTQGSAVAAMFEAAGLTEVEIRTDLDGRNRVIIGRKPL